MQAAAAVIDGLLYQAYVDGLGGDQPAVFDRFIAVARVIHGDFQKRASDATAPPTALQNRMRLLPFDRVVQESFTSFLTDSSLDIVLRATAWRSAPLELRRAAYTSAWPALQQQAQAAGYDPAKAFAAPPGAAPSAVQPATPATSESPSPYVERQ